MKSADRRAVSRLPVSASAWEVALVDLPVTVEGVDIEGLLVVVEQSSALVRGAGPVVRGDPLWTVLKQAFVEPAAPSSPALPKRLLCADPKLAARLRAEVAELGVTVEVVGSVPAADEAVAALGKHFEGPGAAPGITVDAPLWAAALDTFCRLAPWRRLTDAVTFRFEGAPELEGAVAIVIGLAGEQEGLVLYTSEESYTLFTGQAGMFGPDPDVLAHVEALCAYVDPAEQFELDEIAACREAGLGLPGGRFPRVMALRAGRGDVLDEREQRVLLAAIEAVVGLCVADLAVLELEPKRRSVRTNLGVLTVSSTPAPDDADVADEGLIDVDHALAVGRVQGPDGKPEIAVAVKMRKKDAERIAARLAPVDGLRIEPHGRTRVLHALVGAEELGLLVATDTSTDELDAASAVVVCISAGGPSRPRIDPAEFVWVRRIAVRR